MSIHDFNADPARHISAVNAFKSTVNVNLFKSKLDKPKTNMEMTFANALVVGNMCKKLKIVVIV